MARVRRIAVWTARIVVLLLAATVGLAAAAVLAARTEPGRAWLRETVLRHARQAVPGLDFARIRGDLVHEIVFDDVSVLDRAGRRAVALRHLRARYDLLPLLRRTLRVRAIDIEAPVVLGRPEPDGALNLTRLAAPNQPGSPPPAAPPAPPSRWRVQLDRLRVQAGSADIQGADGATTLVSGLSLEGAGAWEAGVTTAVLRVLTLRIDRDGSPAEILLSGDARLEPETLAVNVDRLRVTGLLPADPIEVSATLAGPLRRVAVDVTARAGRAGRVDAGGTFALQSGGLGAYDLRIESTPLVLSRLGAGMPAGRAQLLVTARGYGVPLAPGSHAAATLDVPPARVAGIDVQAAHLTAATEDDRWRVPRGVVRASGATLALSARGVGSRLTGDLQIDVHGPLPRALHERLDGATRERLPAVRGRGRLDVHVAAQLPRHLDLTARGAARDISAGAFHLSALGLDAKVALTRKTVRGGIRLAARGVVLGTRLPRLDALSVDATSEGGTLRLRGSASGPWLRGAVALHGPLAPRHARITIDQLSLGYETHTYKQSLALQAPVTVDYRAGERVQLGRAEVRGAGYLLSGALAVEGTYRLEPGERGPAGSVELILRHASLVGLDPIDGSVRAALDEHRVETSLDARAGRGHVHLAAALPVIVPRRGPPRLAPRGPMTLHLAARGLALADLPAAARRLQRAGIGTASMDATVDLEGDVTHPTGSAAVELAGLGLRNLRDRSAAQVRGLALSARLDAGTDEIRLRASSKLGSAVVVQADAQANTDLGALRGGASLVDAPLRATADIPGFDLRWLAQVDSAAAGVAGTLTGRVEAAGTLRHPSARGDLKVTNGVIDRVTFGEVLAHAEGERTARDGGGRLDLTVRVPQAAGGLLAGEAHLREGSLRAHVGAKDVDLAFLRPFLPGVREVGGKLQIGLDASGRLAAPELRGSAGVTGGRLGVIGQPTFQDVTVAASLRPGRADVGELSARSGKGTLTAHGSVELEGLHPQAVTLTAHADNFLISAAGSATRIDGDLAAEAALREAVIAGKVRVPHAVVRLPSVRTGGGRDLQDIRPRPDVHFVDPAARAAAEHQARRARAPARPPRRLDLTAEADPVFVRSKDFDLEVESRLQLGTIAGADGETAVTLAGTVRIRRGHVSISGQRFEVDRGQLAFDGSPRPNPGLDIRLSRQYPDAVVSIELGGTSRDPKLRMASDPPIYDQAQILSLILTGQAGTRPGGASPAAGGAPGLGGLPIDPASTVASLVLGRLADTLAPELGLDVLRLENVEMKTTGGMPTGLTDTRIEVGKYVTDRIFISYAHIFGAPNTGNANEARIEYRLTNRWVVQTIFGDAGAGSVDALWTWRR